MKFTISSIQTGEIVSEGDRESRDALTRHWTTGFYKTPVRGPVSLTRLGIAGDHVADKQNHGGPDKAILCYAESHYRAWNEELPELAMSSGSLAENLTVAGADESSICIGDVFRIGDCEIEISQPRQPCWKIARRWGVKTLVKTVTQTGRTGWYARVRREGQIEAGMQAERLKQPHPMWSVQRARNSSVIASHSRKSRSGAGYSTHAS